MHLLNAFDKLIHINLVISILIDLLYHFLQFSLNLWIDFPTKYQTNLLPADLAVLITIEEIECFSKPLLLLLLLLLQSKSNELTELK
jgi:hypothetical protein